MKQELYHYAISLKSKNLSNIPAVCLWILLSIFLVPLILSNIVFGLILFFSYILFYFFSKKEPDKYDRELLSLGLFLLFLGIEFFTLTQIQYNVIVSLVMATLAFLISYELLFSIKVKKKRYSNGNQNKKAWVYIDPLIFGVAGICAGKLIANSGNTDLKLWIVVLVCSLLITYSFTIFQKYFIHKIINNINK